MSRSRPSNPGRRRALGVLAGAAAALHLPASAAAGPHTRWRGVALGGEVSLTIRDPDRVRARQAIAACVAEIERIESVFSLHRPASAVVRLNEAGVLTDPPPGLVAVLAEAARVSALSAGAFDVTVQPLWQAHVRALRERVAAGVGEAVERARALVDWRRLAIAADRIALAERGMAVTLNGIAQGYATDRVAELLRRHGFPHILINLGEFRGLGERAPGEPWRIGVGWPGREGVAAVLVLADRAVATSSPLATPLGGAGTVHHLFDPATGRSARSWASVTVVAATAVAADALSTAIAVAPAEAAEAILTAGGGETAILMDARGRWLRLRG